MKRNLLTLILLTFFSQTLTFGQGMPTSEEKSDTVDIFDMSFEQLLNLNVQSSALFDIKKFQEPGKSYVYNMRELNLIGIHSTSDMLDMVVPAVNMSYHARTSDLIGVRGIVIDANSKTLSLRNNVGMNIRTHYGILGADLKSPLTGDINRVEVMLGPGALQHGSGAINGYYNAVSHTGATSEGFHGNVAYGSGNDKIVELSHGISRDNFSFYIYGGYHETDGVELNQILSGNEYPVGSIPSQEFLDEAKYGYTSPNYKVSSRLQIGNQEDVLSLDLTAYYAHLTLAPTAMQWNHNEDSSWEKEVEAMTESNLGPFKTFNYDVLSIAPKVTFKITEKDKIEFTPVFQAIAAGQLSTKILDDAIDRYSVTSEVNEGMGEEFNYSMKAVYISKPTDKIQFALGGQAGIRDFKKKSELLYADTKEYWAGVETQTTEISGFGEMLFDLSPFTVSAGLRYDYFNISDIVDAQNRTVGADLDDKDVFVGRILGAYKLSENQQVKLVYQQGFRFPEVYFIADNSGKDVDNIGPESMYNTEIHYELGLSSSLSIATNVAYNIYKNTLGWNTDAGAFFNSGDDIQSISSETSITYKALNFTNNLSYSVSVPIDSYETNIKVANDDDSWTKYPTQMFKYYGVFRYEKISAGVVAKLRSGAYIKAVDENGTPAVSEAYRNLSDSWAFNMGVTLGYELSENISFTGRVSHITNDYQNINFYGGAAPLKAGLRPEGVLFNISAKFNF